MAEERGRIKRNNPPKSSSNPCYKEQEMSYECLSKNNYDYPKCALHFENYKACKSFWNEIRIERMRKGIEPLIPEVEEREKIMKERFKEKKTILISIIRFY